MRPQHAGESFYVTGLRGSGTFLTLLHPNQLQRKVGAKVNGDRLCLHVQLGRARYLVEQYPWNVRGEVRSQRRGGEDGADIVGRTERGECVTGQRRIEAHQGTSVTGRERHHPLVRLREQSRGPFPRQQAHEACGALEQREAGSREGVGGVLTDATASRRKRIRKQGQRIHASQHNALRRRVRSGASGVTTRCAARPIP